MIRGIYTAATGMIHQRRRMDAVSNNVANANTTGFRRDMVVTTPFDDELLLRLNTNRLNPNDQIGLLNHGVYANRIMTAFEQGLLAETGKSTDFALVGEGFFTISTDAGEQYTRDGNFSVDSDGMLVTTEGAYVLGEDGPINVGSDNFEVNEQGFVLANGSMVGRLRIVNSPDTELLRKAGDNTFVNPDAGNTMVETGAEVRQGFLENSNVEITREMVNMLEAFRNYETNAQIMRMMDETLGRTVNDIGRI